jgi:hypothetical protein
MVAWLMVRRNLEYDEGMANRIRILEAHIVQRSLTGGPEFRSGMTRAHAASQVRR